MEIRPLTWIAADTAIAAPTILWNVMCWSRGKMAAKGVDRSREWHLRNTRTNTNIQLKLRSIPPTLETIM